MMVVTWMAARRGAFRPRSVIEIRREVAGNGVLALTVGGAPGGGVIRILDDGVERTISGGDMIDRFAMLRSATFEFDAKDTRQLKIWVHGVTAEGDSEPIGARVSLDAGTNTEDLGASGEGTVLLDLPEGHARVEVTLKGAGA
jgi:hypothetical protein